MKEKSGNVRKLELLAPAANADTGIQAVLHGADAVYIGGPSHGARKSASNTVGEIERLVDFAHRYRAKIYVTVNTIVYEDELKGVERLCRDLYHAGVDALIVQDMALLRLNLPPIALHASTQCDIRTPAKARFLQDVGFSQLVLARELTLAEIRAITEAVTVPVECFVHGALCVSYSGRCHASCAQTGRSANRGECAQICRHRFTLTDAEGKELAKDKYLLSLHDFNATGSLGALVEAGVDSFKIEGRLKDAAYVKNITAHYNNELNRIVASQSGLQRSSYGDCKVSFTPDPAKSFNRGFSDYFLTRRRPEGLATMLTPKSMGEPVTDLSQLRNGDGISYFDAKGEYRGVNVNGLRNGRIITNKGLLIPPAGLRRTSSIEWDKALSRPTAERTLWVDMRLDDKGLTLTDERGVAVRTAHDLTVEPARGKTDLRSEFAKTGGTPYRLRNFTNLLGDGVFVPRSETAALRRRALGLLDTANKAVYPYERRRPENMDVPYVQKKVDYRTNVANSVARRFYQDHGAEVVSMAMETEPKAAAGTVLMTTRHCVLRELGLCKRLVRGQFTEPLALNDDTARYRLHFNCADCEMEVLKGG